nr:MAG TPA: hypothetical protein [Caudoviricetes sp.]
MIFFFLSLCYYRDDVQEICFLSTVRLQLSISRTI